MLSPLTPLPGARLRSRASVLVALLFTVLGASATPASAGTVSGTAGTPGDATISYTMTGGDFSLKPGTSHEYVGNYAGGPVTLSGTITVTRAPGTVSAVSMSAGIAGTAKWEWPTGGGAQDVSGTTVTQTFSLTYSPIPYDTLRGFLYGGANVELCGGVCASIGVGFNLTMPKEPVATPTPAPTPPPVTGDTTPPTVRALPIGQILRIGTSYKQKYWVKDDSKKAYVYADLFDGGTNIGHSQSKGLMTANGFHEWVNTRPGKTRKGPLEFCVWAKDAAGNTSAKAPKSSCSWLDVLVPVKNVSNQCGGAGWDSVVEFENYVGNTSDFYDPGTRDSYTVNFSDACNLHDAGYGGHTVRDMLDGRRGHRPIVNFRKWSRSEVDRKFQIDMQKICRREIEKKAKIARRDCIAGTGRYDAVRLVGRWFFDADLRTAGTQATGHRVND